MLCKTQPNLKLLLALGALLCQLGLGDKPDWCAPHLVSLASDRTEKSAPPLDTVDDMLWAFSNGLVPDPHSQEQLRAFEVYLNLRFGEAKNASDTGSRGLGSVIAKVAEKLKAHPELTKVPLRNFIMATQERSYPVTQELAQVSRALSDAAGEARGKLFQIEANLGYWKKVLGWQDAAVPAHLQIKREWSTEEKERVRKERRDWEAAEKAKFIEELDRIVPPAHREELSIAKTPESVQAAAGALFNSLKTNRELRVRSQVDVSSISRAMADLVHTIGFHDPETQLGLKSEDGMKRIAAIRKALDEREQFAMRLGYAEHFDGLLAELKLSGPSGVESDKALIADLTKTEQDVSSKASVKTTKGTVREIRQLSVMEAPFRSCVGGSDCSSRTYLTRALDPNYQYFTMTDEDGHSSGHITIVLGSAKTGQKKGFSRWGKGGEEEKLAFVDKIMNVPNEDLPILIEAVRRSVLEKGYTLVMPEDLGDNQSGLSNYQSTIDFVTRWITRKGDLIPSFKPHSHDYKLDSRYSRAERGLAVRKVAELKLPESAQLFSTQQAHSWKTPKLDLNALVLGSRKLKDGDVDSKIRYVEAQEMLEAARLEVDPEYRSALESWMQDSSQPFRLRKRILLSLWPGKEHLEALLAPFTPPERADLVWSLLDTPRLRPLVLASRDTVLELMVAVRANHKLVSTLGDEFQGVPKEAWIRVLSAPDVSDTTALQITKQMPKTFKAMTFNGATEVLWKAEGTSVEPELSQLLASAYLKRATNPTKSARETVSGLGRARVTREFAKRLLRSQLQADAPLPVLRAAAEIESLADSRNLDHRSAAQEWMADLKTSPDLKAEYLRSTIWAMGFEDLTKKLPTDQKESVFKQIREHSMGLELREIAKQKGIIGPEFSTFVPEGSEHTWLRFPQGGKKVLIGVPGAIHANRMGLRDVTFKKPFLMGKTPVPQWLYALVMESNPSQFKSGPDSIEVAINTKLIRMNPNYPVEHVSHGDATEFCRRLTALMNNGIKYQLPSEAHTDWVSSLKEPHSSHIVWHRDNSNELPHPVAELKPNAFGLYDTLGNVWEWQRDGFTEETSRLPATDPEVPSQKEYVVRGGAWTNSLEELHVIQRYRRPPGHTSSVVGFRIEGTPE